MVFSVALSVRCTIIEGIKFVGAWKKLICGRQSHQLGVFSRESCLPRRSCVRKLSAEQLSSVRMWRAGTSSDAGVRFGPVLQHILEEPNLDLETMPELEPEHGPNKTEPVQSVRFRSTNRFGLEPIASYYKTRFIDGTG